jgi:hypothetical protein
VQAAWRTIETGATKATHIVLSFHAWEFAVNRGLLSRDGQCAVTHAWSNLWMKNVETDGRRSFFFFVTAAAAWSMLRQRTYFSAPMSL